mgnify:CR=1 FL=1
MFEFLNKVIDPVCGMKINKKEAKFSSSFENSTYSFCSENCKEKFESDPKKYVSETNHAGGCCH